MAVAVPRFLTVIRILQRLSANLNVAEKNLGERRYLQITSNHIK